MRKGEERGEVGDSALVVGRIDAPVRPEILSSQYLAQHLTLFQQTYINDALWNRD